MVPEIYSKPLMDAYEAHKHTYEAFTLNVADLLQRLVEENSIDYFAIESRTKSFDSFVEKIVRPDKAEKYETIDDVTDISGVRVISYMSEDVDSICRFISENFVIDEINSTDKEDLMDPDRFGYLSVHYVISYNKDRLKLPEFQRFAGLKAELQVRTILQHTWAAIDWKLRYKSDQEVPRALKRRLYRISALLEAADEDFSVIGNEIDEIRQQYVTSVQKDHYDLMIDRESLEVFIRNSRVVRELEKVAVKCGVSISPPPANSRNPYLSLLSTLKSCKIDRLSELESLIKDKNLNQERLSLIFQLWHGPTMPNKMVLDVAGIMRLLVIMSAEKNFARDVLETHKFGPTIQQAVIAAIT